MAARIEPDRVHSAHQSLHHFVADAPWSDAALLEAVRGYVLDRVTKRSRLPHASARASASGRKMKRSAKVKLITHRLRDSAGGEFEQPQADPEAGMSG